MISCLSDNICCFTPGFIPFALLENLKGEENVKCKPPIASFTFHFMCNATWRVKILFDDCCPPNIFWLSVKETNMGEKNMKSAPISLSLYSHVLYLML